MREKIRFAVVGLGMGAHHALAISKANGAALAAVCDKDRERLEPIAKQYGCKAYDSFPELLKDPEIQAVSIVTESGFHAGMGIAAARAGKHILVKKPIDVTMARVRMLEKAVAAAQVKCGCVFQSRLDACNQKLKQCIDTGKMGRLFGVHAGLPWFRGAAYFSGPHGVWRGTWKLDGGGSMMNQGIHTVDLMTFFGGPVKRVCGFLGRHNHDIESEDQTVACLQFANGVLGTIYTTTCAVPEGSQHFYCFGEKGSFRKTGDCLEQFALGSVKERARMLRRFGKDQGEGAVARDPMAVSAEGHRLIVEDLVKAIREDRDPIIPLSSAKHAVEIVCAVYRSSRMGRAVDVASAAR